MTLEFDVVEPIPTGCSVEGADRVGRAAVEDAVGELPARKEAAG